MLELAAGVVRREAPIDRLAGGIALRLPGGNRLFQGGAVCQPPVQTLPGERAQLDLTEPISVHVLCILRAPRWSGERCVRRGLAAGDPMVAATLLHPLGRPEEARAGRGTFRSQD